MAEKLHVYPVGDLVEHDTSMDGECICGPDWTFVPGGVVITHHSLDDREQRESAAGGERNG